MVIFQFLFFKIIFFSLNQEWPLGFPLGNYPTPQGRYYCSIGDNNAFGRAYVEAGVRCTIIYFFWLKKFIFILNFFSGCVAAGINISGINAEVAPSNFFLLKKKTII